VDNELRQYLKEERSKRMRRAHYIDLRRMQADKKLENRALAKEAGVTDVTGSIHNLGTSAIETAPDVAFLGTPPLPQ
jgi:hypothetical protein